MAEIKSTLDLIMERTKDLTMTAEEKKNHQRQALQGKVRGWVQRYLDGMSAARELNQDLEVHRDDRKTLEEMLRAEALSHIQPYGDNKRMLQLLQDVLGEDTKPISRQIETFTKAMRGEMPGHLTRALQTLAEKGIRGSAVLPNLEKDPAWQAWLSSASDAFKKSLGVTAAGTNNL